MSAGDVGVTIATAATLILAVYAGVEYLRSGTDAKSLSFQENARNRAIRRWTIIPLAVVFAAWSAVLFGYFAQSWVPPRTVDLFDWSLTGEPIGWEMFLIGTSRPLRVEGLTVIGKNLSDDTISLGGASFKADNAGNELPMQVGLAGNYYPLSDLNPIPPGAVFILSANFDRVISRKADLRYFLSGHFVADYDGKRHVINFKQPRIFKPRPRITRADRAK